VCVIVYREIVWLLFCVFFIICWRVLLLFYHYLYGLLFSQMCVCVVCVCVCVCVCMCVCVCVCVFPQLVCSACSHVFIHTHTNSRSLSLSHTHTHTYTHTNTHTHTHTNIYTYILISAGGRLYTFGNNAHGQLGHGDTKERHAPTLVTSFKDINVVHVAAGTSHGVAVIS